MKPNNISNAQVEVWEWKEKAAAEVDNLDLQKALDISVMNSIRIMEKLGLKPSEHKYTELKTFICPYLTISKNTIPILIKNKYDSYALAILKHTSQVSSGLHKYPRSY
jgi:hypothetical protein